MGGFGGLMGVVMSGYGSLELLWMVLGGYGALMGGYVWTKNSPNRSRSNKSFQSPE